MKKKLLFSVLFCSLFFAEKTFSQGQANIWFFGAFSGIDFNSGSPVTIPGPINTLEGCASICDSNGVLLFSTDGVTVYNSTNAVMGTGLNGNSSSTQSAIIFPFPASLTKYYIFTVDGFGWANGLNYTIVDMTLNGGLGGIVTQNNPLATPVSEKVTAVYATNDTDIWVITHMWMTNEFYVYKVTPAGIDPPVITAIGFNPNTGTSFLGYLKSSPDGSKLAASYSGTAGFDALEVYDFNNVTGAVSNVVSIPSPFEDSYGVCFSPDNTKLYFSSWSATNAIYQYDLSIANFANNPYLIYGGGNIGFGAIQLAPDGKIYFAEDGTSSLSVISNPNGAGAACNFVLNSFPITGTSHYGLPTYFDQLFTNNCSVNLGVDTSLCGINPLMLNAGTGSVTGYLWQDGSTTQNYLVDTTGIYFVTKTYSNGCIARDTIAITIHPVPDINLGNDTVVCHPGTVTLDAGTGYFSYHWSTGTGGEFLIPQVTGQYIVLVLDTNFCKAKDTINVAFHGPEPFLGNDTTVCIGDSVLLTPGSIFKTYQWYNNNFDSLNMVYGAGSYSVTVFDFQGCFASDTIEVIVSEPKADLGNDTLLCGTINYTLNTGNSFSVYHWNNNSANSTLTIHAPGTYSVSVTDQYGCTANDAIVITNSDPHVAIGNDTLICIRITALMQAPAGFETYLWSNGSTTENTTAFEGGTFTVTVTNDMNCPAVDSKIISIDSPKVYIGNDTSSCNGAGISI
ncbi:MAG: hypothetical protein WCI97_05035, partial [Bacteroidota bacterium]